MTSFLQSKEWLGFQASLGNKTWRFDNGKIKANIIKLSLPLRHSVLYIPHGPEIDFNAITGSISHELGAFAKHLKDLAKAERAMFVKIEPLDDKVPEQMHQFGFKKSKKEYQPHRTVIVDLEKSEDELLAAMHHKTRYNIKVAERHGLKLVFRKDIDAFWKLLRHTAKHDNFFTHTKEYYDKLCSTPGLMAETAFIEHDGNPIAGAIWLAYGDTAYYLHGAMDRDSKYKPMMAPHLLHWELMKTAKQYGMKHYDFWGIDAAKWPGITRFKLGFGGRQVEYSGAFDLSVRKFWFLVYKIFRRK
ncbi:MAG TPA: peptidoglycan bridge formation glycyltransferase FemA/FemB family protein [Candidatus Paceibacterota bacterium]|nr:peptidoglycan bridge formation glycyltransferase FemA/FemB family protein [Candidatus Paceibacterota bacterium]